MSVIMNKNLIGLPVETVSGEQLGKIFDFELEVDSQAILKYFVKGGNIFKDMFAPEFIIHRNQVVSMDNKKMVVEEGVVGDKVRKIVNNPIPIT